METVRCKRSREKKARPDDVRDKLGCSLVATVGEAKMTRFPNHFFGSQNTTDAQGVPSNNIN